MKKETTTGLKKYEVIGLSTTLDNKGANVGTLKKEYNSHSETAHLMSTEANRKRLESSIKSLIELKRN